MVEKLTHELALKEKELQVMKEGAEELKLLQQQNYVLQSKVQVQEPVFFFMCLILNSVLFAFSLLGCKVHCWFWI